MENLPVYVTKSKRKTISLELKTDGIYIRAPWGMKTQDIRTFLSDNSKWIEKHYQKMLEKEKVLEKVVPFTADEIQELADQAVKVIPEKVQHYAEKIGVSYGRITIRNQRTRWGSCSSKGNLNFNCLLMLFPDEVIDSIVVHELCHRKHMNHSADFYAEVERVFPQYKKCQKWLKENGEIYLRRLP